MTTSVGIKEFKEALKAGLQLGNIVGHSLQDSFKVMEILSLLKDLPAAFQGLDKVPSELADLDEAEKAELYAFVESEFNIPQDEIESYVEKALQFVISFGDLVGKFIK